MPPKSASIPTRGDRRLLPRSLMPADPGPSSKTKDNPLQRQSPVVRGRKRCRMHGGAHGSGAPSGKSNGNYRDGLHTAKAIAERRVVRAWLRSMRTQID
jgi:glucans biosynthesis protein